MWYGLGEYVAVSAGVAIVVHLACRRYLVASLAGAVVCSILNLIHESWAADFRVNPGWAPFLLTAGFLAAMPVCFLAGLPFLLIRRSRRSDDPFDSPADPWAQL